VADQAVVLEVCFFDMPETIRGSFFILPGPGAMDALLLIGDKNG